MRLAEGHRIHGNAADTRQTRPVTVPADDGLPYPRLSRRCIAPYISGACRGGADGTGFVATFRPAVRPGIMSDESEPI